MTIFIGPDLPTYDRILVSPTTFADLLAAVDAQLPQSVGVRLGMRVATWEHLRDHLVALVGADGVAVLDLQTGGLLYNGGGAPCEQLSSPIVMLREMICPGSRMGRGLNPIVFQHKKETTWTCYGLLHKPVPERWQGLSPRRCGIMAAQRCRLSGRQR